MLRQEYHVTLGSLLDFFLLAPDPSNEQAIDAGRVHGVESTSAAGD